MKVADPNFVYDPAAFNARKPLVVCLCGSTRFKDAFAQAFLLETLAGHIVLSVGCFTHSDSELGITEEQKKRLDALHFRKVEMADEIFVMNVDGYIGWSTANEINHAIRLNKPVRFLEPEAGATWMQQRKDLLDALG